MPDTPSTHSSPRWGAGGNPEQGEWAKAVSAQRDHLFSVVQYALDAHEPLGETRRAATLALRRIEQQLEAAQKVVEAARAAWANDARFPNLVAALREYDSNPASGRDVGHRPSPPGTNITGDGTGETLPPIVEVGEQPLRTSNPASSPEITGDGSGHSLPPIQEGYSPERSDSFQESEPQA